MTKLTAKTITDRQIHALLDESIDARDDLQCAICEVAMDGQSRTPIDVRESVIEGEMSGLRRLGIVPGREDAVAIARRFCADAINNARAQED